MFLAICRYIQSGLKLTKLGTSHLDIPIILSLDLWGTQKHHISLQKYFNEYKQMLDISNHTNIQHPVTRTTIHLIHYFFTYISNSEKPTLPLTDTKELSDLRKQLTNQKRFT